MYAPDTKQPIQPALLNTNTYLQLQLIKMQNHYYPAILQNKARPRPKTHHVDLAHHRPGEDFERHCLTLNYYLKEQQRPEGLANNPNIYQTVNTICSSEINLTKHRIRLMIA